jgi:hypothetical protein
MELGRIFILMAFYFLAASARDNGYSFVSPRFQKAVPMIQI